MRNSMFFRELLYGGLYDCQAIHKSSWVGPQLNASVLIIRIIKFPRNSKEYHDEGTKVQVALTGANGAHQSTFMGTGFPITNNKATSHTRLRARESVTITLQALSLVEKVEPVKSVSHYAWGINGVSECNMDTKSTWTPTWHQMDHVSWLLGLFSNTTSWR